jgi:hypothetical protein
MVLERLKVGHQMVHVTRPGLRDRESPAGPALEPRQDVPDGSAEGLADQVERPDDEADEDVEELGGAVQDPVLALRPG